MVTPWKEKDSRDASKSKTKLSPRSDRHPESDVMEAMVRPHEYRAAQFGAW